VPLQSRIDFLKLHTGKSFEIPFDELVIFSTNLQPTDLMDPAFLRRIPYKLETCSPNDSDFGRIFEGVARKEGLLLAADIVDHVIAGIRHRFKADLACYQPRFIVDQVIAACKYQGVAAAFTMEVVEDALANLYPRSTAPRMGSETGKPRAQSRSQPNKVPQPLICNGARGLSPQVHMHAGQTRQRSGLRRRWVPSEDDDEISEDFMKISEVMTRNPEVVRPDATVQEAARKMDALNVGALPVLRRRAPGRDDYRPRHHRACHFCGRSSGSLPCQGRDERQCGLLLRR
jgi:hypothetical protein